MKRARQRTERRRLAVPDAWGARQDDRGGRPVNRAPESPTAAKAYMEDRWGRQGFARSLAAVGVGQPLWHAESLSRLSNARFAKARDLRELLNERPVRVALREVETLARAIGRPAAAEARLFAEALEALRHRCAELAERASVGGGREQFALAETALDAYRKAPSKTTRRKLEEVLGQRDVDLRTEIVSAVRRAGVVERSATVWAHWGIASGLEDPCSSEELERERRTPWRRAITAAAKFSGQLQSEK